MNGGLNFYIENQLDVDGHAEGIESRLEQKQNGAAFGLRHDGSTNEPRVCQPAGHFTGAEGGGRLVA